MNVEDIHKNLSAALLEDEKYKQLINSIEDKEEQKQLSEFMSRMMNYFQSNMFDPLTEKMEDPEFLEELAKNMESMIPNSRR